MLYSIFLVAAGLATLFVGGETLVRSSVVLAHKFGLSRLLVGLLIVGFGTSMPELMVSIEAVFDGAPSIALGNVVGSNIANVLLIIGVAALLFPIANWDNDAKRGALIATGVGVLFYLLCLQGQLSALHGWMLLAVLAIYFAYSYLMMARHKEVGNLKSTDAIDVWLTRHTLPAIAAVVVGIGLLVLGADLLVAGAVTIAHVVGISDAVIGLSLVAIGTSLPELTTAIVSSMKREPEVVIGSVIGSNIFNILVILGITLTLGSISIEARIAHIDAPLVVATSLGLLLLLAFTKRMGRGTGLVLLALYCGYAALWLPAYISGG